MHAITYLAPALLPLYQLLIDHLSARLGIAITLRVGAADYSDLHQADLAFICGLPYVLHPELEALAAPVLAGGRYGGKPIYFSDVVVGVNNPAQTFADLRGASWAYNEPLSQSGYGITRYEMLQRGLTDGFFGKVVAAGFHQKALEMVAAGVVDAAAIDSHVLELAPPALRIQLRVIETFGASTIQPLAAARRLPPPIRAQIRHILGRLHTDPRLAEALAHWRMVRWVGMKDRDYDDIRAMLAACQAAGYLTLR